MVTGQPLMARAFGDAWDKIPPVFHAHYANHAQSTDRVTVSGNMAVFTSILLRPFAFLVRHLGLMPFENTDHVAVTVDYESEPEGDGFWLRRQFGLSPHHNFDSCMQIQNDGSVREYMAAGLIWHFDYRWDGTAVRLCHRRFYIQIAGAILPLPVMLFGRCDAVERALDDQRFSAQAVMRHWLFGRLYEYAGVFTIEKD